MKAVELLRLYEAGRRDFSGESLRGQNFTGEDLSGADFSRVDIRSTNFTNTNLTEANFTQAKAGLQRRWAIGLLFASLLLSALSGVLSAFVGYFVAIIFDSGSFENQATGCAAIAVLVAFFIITIRKGVVAVAVAVSFAVAVAVAIAVAVASTGAGEVAAAVTFAFVGAFAGEVAFAFAFAFVFKLAIAVAVISVSTVASTVAIASTVASTGSFTFANAFAFVFAFAFAFAITLLSAYIGWRVWKGDPKDAWIRSAAVAFAAIGGTSFRGATLTDANFSQACLKSTDFRRSSLLRTRWRGVKKLDRVRPGETYLHKPKICDLVRTGNGQGQSYDHYFNLKGINLQGANLAAADFSGSVLKYGTFQGANLVGAHFKNANLNYVNLQDADLTDSKLIQTQLNQADFTGAILTGAYIEDWGITTTTNLHGIQCDYVFMRFPREGCSDPNPHRKPDDWSKTFADGEFVDFITPMVETLDLYHNQTVDPRAVAIAFSDLRKQNPDADLEIVSMEKRGPNLDKFNLRVRTSPQADRSQLHHEYFDRYEHLLTLSPQALIALLMEKEEKSQMLAGIVGTAINRSGTHINTYQNQGNTTVSEQGSNAPKYDLSNAQFAGGFAETVQGDQIGGTINNYGAKLDDITQLITSLRELAQSFPAEQKDDALMELDDIEADVNKP
ncbi:MAG: pentapeptide repeat-containing protein, partial [Cyanobacteria bacterium P01_G01_bin.54]